MNSRNTIKNEDLKLPDGWILCSSKSKTGRKYYFNTRTGKSSWTKPENTQSKPGQKQKKEKEKDINIGESSNKKSMKRKSDGNSEQSSIKKRKEETKSPDQSKQEPDTTKTSSNKLIKAKPKGSPNKSHNSSQNFKVRHSSSPVNRKSSLSSIGSAKKGKNLANNRLSQLRAELADQVSQEEKKTDTKTQKDNQDQTNDFNQQSPSPSQFLAANKILSSMKAQLPDKYSNKKQKDTYADIEEGINKTDYPVLKPPGTPPQFSEASKLVSAIKSKLSYKGSKDNTFQSAKDRMESMRARLSNEMDSSEVENHCDEITEAMDVDSKEPKTLPGCSTPSSAKSVNKTESSNNKKDKVILVVDTNIFIHKLDFIKNIMNSHIEGYNEAPTLLVPWRVINELDRLKDNNNGYTAISKRARPAMDYLYKCLPENDRIKVQPLREANSHIYPCESPDDEILNCCLQQAERGHSVILLSNDKNLCNKAITNGIEHKQLETLAVRPRPQSPASPHAAANIIKHVYTLLANILENEMRAKYDHLWLHVLFKAPPWSLSDVLQCLTKHWIAVFNEVFPRIEHIIVDMKNALTNIQKKAPHSLTQSEVSNFKELCIDLAKRCQIIPEYMELAKKTVALLETDCATETEDKAEQDGDTHVIAALEQIWNIFSSYCAKLATQLNIPHSIEDRLSGGETLEGLTDKLPLFGEQISTLADAMERVLLSDETTTQEMLKMYINHFDSAIKDSLKTIGGDVDHINEGNLTLFSTKCKNMLQEASGKFSELVRLLEVCRERLL